MILKRFFTLFFLLAVSFFAEAQQVHFVYLQTENAQPFYVKLDNKVTSSSSSGYLILPKLADSAYKISIGFPKKEFPEESFEISVDKDNKGFLLKNFGEKGWGLFNLQSFALVMGNNSTAAPATANKLQDDPFSKMLAKVVKDSSILEKNIVDDASPDQQKTVADTVATNRDNTSTKTTEIKDIDTSAMHNETEIKSIDTTASIPDSATSANKDSAKVSLSDVTQILRDKNADGVEMVYIDKNENSRDTVRIFIPVDKTVAIDNTPAKVANANNDSGIVKKEPTDMPVTDTSAKVEAYSVLQQNNDSSKSISEDLSQGANKTKNKDTVTPSINNDKKDSASNNLKPIETIDITGDEIKRQSDAEKEFPKVVQSSSTNSDCHAFASNDDFMKLRTKMAAENNNDDMIKAAKKFFRSECFSTEQIKNLSLLLLNDQGKYQFFEAAYPFTSDSSQYHILQSQLKDPYYVNHFKALIHK
ncbi:MAG: DUF4476 domain-containing protein [Ginsengibacter sp.]